MTKIAISGSYIGFLLSEDAINEVNMRKGTNYTTTDIQRINRSDQDLIAAIEKLGDKANGISNWTKTKTDIRIIEIPDGIEWEILDYDNIECVQEVARRWVHPEPEADCWKERRGE